MTRQLLTSESVTEGHPDKMCDQISDAILDELIASDPESRVACETLVTTGMALVSGQISTKCYADIPKIVRETIREIGYINAEYGFDAHTCAVLTSIDEQSADIALGVDTALEVRETEDENEIGAGDQGMMYGYATNETDAYLPMPIFLAHNMARRLAEVRKSGELAYLRPDGKTQVTVVYEDGKPVAVDTVVISAQHAPDVSQEKIREDLLRLVAEPTLPAAMKNGDIKYFVNPTGRFVIGGPQSDTGLTGRKIIVDTYGGLGLHGGGCFSGKDPTKVDRSGAYAARYVAKNIVAAGLAARCEIQLAYAIGVAKPVSINVNTFGTGKLPDEKMEGIVAEIFDLRPRGIIAMLDLKKPIYRQTAAYGHFGRTDISLSWEKMDRLEMLKERAGL